MKHAQNLGRYDDLIFCPLDLPPPPVVDSIAFINWMQVKGSSNMKPARAFEKLTGHQYPWLSAFDGNGAVELRDSFPAVYKYLTEYPFDEIDHVVLLAQRGHQPIFTHTDTDWLCGMRLYLTSKNKEGLHFYRGREKYDEFETYKIEHGTIVGADWNASHHMDAPVYARFPENCQTFMLNSGRAAHAVDANTCELGERIAVLIRGRHNQRRFDDLMERSLAKFGEYAIWY